MRASTLLLNFNTAVLASSNNFWIWVSPFFIAFINLFFACFAWMPNMQTLKAICLVAIRAYGWRNICLELISDLRLTETPLTIRSWASFKIWIHVYLESLCKFLVLYIGFWTHQMSVQQWLSNLSSTWRAILVGTAYPSLDFSILNLEAHVFLHADITETVTTLKDHYIAVRYKFGITNSAFFRGNGRDFEWVWLVFLVSATAIRVSMVFPGVSTNTTVFTTDISRKRVSPKSRLVLLKEINSLF